MIEGPGRRYVERLGLDPTRIERMADGAEELASMAERGGGAWASWRKLSSDSPGTSELQVASLLLLAGSLRMAVGQMPAGARSFVAATDHYVRAGHGFAVVTAACGGLRDMAPLLRSVPTAGGKREIEDRTWLGLGQVMHAVETGDHGPAIGASQSLRALGPRPLSRPIGRLRVPALHYARIMDAAMGVLEQPRATASLRESLRDLVRRADEAVHVAMDDRYHWTRIASHVLPVEPELLAMAVMSHTVALHATGETLVLNPDELGTYGYVVGAIAQEAVLERGSHVATRGVLAHAYERIVAALKLVPRPDRDASVYELWRRIEDLPDAAELTDAEIARFLAAVRAGAWEVFYSVAVDGEVVAGEVASRALSEEAGPFGGEVRDETLRRFGL